MDVGVGSSACLTATTSLVRSTTSSPSYEVLRCNPPRALATMPSHSSFVKNPCTTLHRGGDGWSALGGGRLRQSGARTTRLASGGSAPALGSSGWGRSSPAKVATSAGSGARLAWRDSVLSAPAQDSSRSGQSSSPRACSGGSAARQWHARTHSVGAAFVLHTVSQQELARRTRCEATGEAGRSPAGSSRLQTASTTSARALFRVFARVRCCFGTRLQNSREKRPSLFTVLVPVRASPVPVLCPGEGKFIKFFQG